MISQNECGPALAEAAPPRTTGSADGSMTKAQPKAEQQSLWIWPFELKEQIGEGGMGVVYRARYVVNDRELAVKMVPADVSDKTALARFEREMAVLKDLKHPNIVRCFGGVCEDKRRFYAMELIPGGSLEDLLQQRGKFSWEQVVEYGLQMCAALECSHRHGVIHRDVKPGNFLIAANGRLKLSDFGLASVAASRRITQSGKTAGTFLYMAPEQIRGKDLSPQTDLYALGCVLYELLSGRPPFVAETPAATLHMHCKNQPPRVSEAVLDCPPDLEQIIEQLLAKEPADRPASASEVARALRGVTQTVSARPIYGEMGAGVTISNQPLTLREQQAAAAADSGERPAVRGQSDWTPYAVIGGLLLLSLAGLGFVRQHGVSRQWEDQTLQQLQSRDKPVQIAALKTIGRMGVASPRGLEELSVRLDHDNHAAREVRVAAAEALGAVGGGARAYLPALLHAEKSDPDADVRNAAQQAIHDIQAGHAPSASWLLPTALCLLAAGAAGGWYWWSEQHSVASSSALRE
jgi:eukaryotic-like serine/threonine-protein kinase